MWLILIKTTGENANVSKRLKIVYKSKESQNIYH